MPISPAVHEHERQVEQRQRGEAHPLAAAATRPGCRLIAHASGSATGSAIGLTPTASPNAAPAPIVAHHDRHAP